MAKLRDYLIDTGRVQAISIETVRRILHERGVSWQAIETWKASTDPEVGDNQEVQSRTTTNIGGLLTQVKAVIPADPTAMIVP